MRIEWSEYGIDEYSSTVGPLLATVRETWLQPNSQSSMSMLLHMTNEIVIRTAVYTNKSKTRDFDKENVETNEARIQHGDLSGMEAELTEDRPSEVTQTLSGVETSQEEKVQSCPQGGAETLPCVKTVQEERVRSRPQGEGSSRTKSVPWRRYPQRNTSRKHYTEDHIPNNDDYICEYKCSSIIL